MREFRELKEKILRKRPLCENCYERGATQLHHCLVRDSKRYHELVTVEENLMPVCEVCHTSLEQTVNRFEVRVKFAERQVERGYDIAKWYNELPIKVKEHWLENMRK